MILLYFVCKEYSKNNKEVIWNIGSDLVCVAVEPC